VETLLHQGALYPLSVYPFLFQWVLTFLLPVGFISFYPACEFLGQSARSSLPLELALWTPCVGLVSFAVAHRAFRRGLRRYEGAGS
jgi:ABC-2 type transport system permease protein